MTILNTLLVFKEYEKGHKIANQLKSWNFTTTAILNSLNELLEDLNEFDLILMDPFFKNSFEEFYNKNKDFKSDMALIYVLESSNIKNIDLKLFTETYTQLYYPFSFSEFRSAVEIAYYKKNHQKTIKKSEELSKEILNASHDSLLIIDNNGNILDANTSAAKRLNKSKEEIIGFNFKKFIDKDIADSRWKHIQKAIDSRELVEFEDIRGDIYFSNKIIPLSRDGMVDLVVIDSKDITDQKNYENELLKVNSYNRTLIESSIDPFLTLNFDGYITDVNNALMRIMELKREQIVGTNFLKYFNQTEKAKNAFKQTIEDGYIENYPLEVGIDKPRSVLVNASKYYDEESNSHGIFAAIRDVTDLKNVENELNKSEERLKSIMEGSPIPQFVIGKDHKILYWNSALEQLSGLKSSDMIGTDNQWMAFYSEKKPCLADILLDESKEKINSAYNGIINPSKLVKNAYEVTKFFPSIGAQGKWLYFTSASIKNAEGETVAVLETLEDINKTKILEEELKNSLNEKNVLIKEIHHRVKNNLMIISSLLNLQSEYVKDKEDLELFRESQTRAKSMALIHERLYKSEDLKTIDFANYIRFLVKDLLTTYKKEKNKVDLKLDLENINLDINTAIPLGLIVNELVSNSMKHAFPDDINGTIQIILKLKDDKYILAVADNGVGVPEKLDFRNTDSLGLQLVTSLTKQIGGKIELNKVNGSEFKITFTECFK
jgi:PAS domain S-box-containing protein